MTAVNPTRLGDKAGAGPAPQGYEYEMQPFPIGTLDDKKAWLNQMGSEGWQLIQFGGLSSDGTLLGVFIRPV